MEEQKINKNLLKVCGLLLVLGGVFFLFPFGKGDTNQQSNETTTPESNQQIVNNIINSPENPTLEIPSVNQSSIDLSKYSSDSYALSTNEVVNSKKSGLYNTYSDNGDYVANPYYQKYSFSKESGEKDVEIKDYPKSYYGSLATQKDYTSEFPSGSTSTSESKPETETETQTETPTESDDKPKENTSN